METEKTMNSEESILFIQRMINTAKEDLEDSSFHYLLWGWLVFAACTINFILIEISFEMEWIGWALLMPLGGIIRLAFSSTPRIQTTKSEVLAALSSPARRRAAFAGSVASLLNSIRESSTGAPVKACSTLFRTNVSQWAVVRRSI